MICRFLLLGFMIVVFGAHRAEAEEELFYLGSTSAGSPGIFSGSIDSLTGRLGPLALAGKASTPGFLALTSDRRFLYSVTDGAGGISAFTANPDGTLVSLNQILSPSAKGCFASVDRSGHYLLLADYAGRVTCWQILADGSVGRQTASVQLTGSGPDKSRQKRAHAHSIYEDVSGKFVYACDLGSDKIWIFNFDPDAGTLVEAEPAFVTVPGGAGPRHLAFSPTGYVYAVNEMGQSITILKRTAPGVLSTLQTVPISADGKVVVGATAAEIVLHPNGHWLYVSTRGPDTLSLFAVGEDGKLTLRQTFSAQVKWPRYFAIDPSGCWLISAGERDDKIVVLKIDPVTGLLSSTDQSASVKAPSCVLFQNEKAYFKN